LLGEDLQCCSRDCLCCRQFLLFRSPAQDNSDANTPPRIPNWPAPCARRTARPFRARRCALSRHPQEKRGSPGRMKTGNFEFPALPEGHFRVEISQLGFAPATREIDLASGKQSGTRSELDVALSLRLLQPPATENAAKTSRARHLLKKARSPRHPARRPPEAPHLLHRIQPRLPRITARPHLPRKKQWPAMEDSAQAAVVVDATDSKRRRPGWRAPRIPASGFKRPRSESHRNRRRRPKQSGAWRATRPSRLPRTPFR